MNKFADLLEKNLDTLAMVETFDNGKSITMAKADIGLCVACIRYYAGWADKIEGKTIDTGTDTFNYTRQEPVGSNCNVPPPIILLTKRTDRSLRSNYPMELPPSHVLLEDRSCHCNWQLCRA